MIDIPEVYLIIFGLAVFSIISLCVGNQQKWDTLVKERSGRNGSVVGLPEQVVVALSSG